MPVAPLGFALQRFVPLACRRHLSVRLPLLVLPAKRPPYRPSRCTVRLPGCASWQRPTRHRVNMPAPTCVLARDVSGPSIAPVQWMGTRPGAPCSVARQGGRRDSPSDGITVRQDSRPVARSVHPGAVVVRKCRRSAPAAAVSPLRARGPRFVVTASRRRIAAPGSRERSPVVPIGPPGFGLVRFRPMRSRSIASVGNGQRPHTAKPSCTLPHSRAPRTAAPFHVSRVHDGPTPGRNRWRIAFIALAACAPPSCRSEGRPSVGPRGEAANSPSGV